MVNGVGEVFVILIGVFISWITDKELAITIGLSSVYAGMGWMTPVVSAIDLMLTEASTVMHWSGANIV